jgi:hypothetical protein
MKELHKTHQRTLCISFKYLFITGMQSYTPSLLQSYKLYLDDEIDEGFWLRYKLGTWLRQVVDELAHT